MKQVAIIGSTGSVGRNTLDVIGHLSDRFGVFALAANSAVDVLAEQTAAFRPRIVGVTAAERVDEYHAHCKRLGIATPEVVSGVEGLRAVASASGVDIVVSAAVGAAGLAPTHAAVRAGKTVALANKEAMVVGGELLRREAAQSGARIIPIDSEHSALDQCLRSGQRGEVRRLILTASGGPFREKPAEFIERATPAQALQHPTWKMGRRITIDSATMMNKGLEVIEARWLFDIPADRVDIMVHPQSVVHSMVEFIDGAIVAQLGTADMRQPIQYALTYPERVESRVAPLDWSQISRLDFSPPDPVRFPCPSLAYRALETGGTAPAVLNAVDEVAVAAFLDGRIALTAISRLIAKALDRHQPVAATSVAAILDADRWAREFAAHEIVSRSSK